MPSAPFYDYKIHIKKRKCEYMMSELHKDKEFMPYKPKFDKQNTP